jgi:nicotinate phosphoribosyltransferase
VPEGSIINETDAKETIMIIEGRIQELIEIETLYLGVISAASSKPLDFKEIKKNAENIVKAAEGIPVTYFGARHFHYSEDAMISKICKEAGMVAASTDIGGAAWGADGVGTIPHALVLAYGDTLTAVARFEKYMPPSAARIALIDTYNREIDDSLAVCEALGENLTAVRMDTPGETTSQGSETVSDKELEGLDEKYKHGTGVRIAGAWALRRALDKAGFKRVGLFLSSGFSAEKTRAFVEADKRYRELYGNPLLTAIGTGSISPASRFATSDIVSIYDETQRKWIDCGKVGRVHSPTDRLV